MKKLFSIVSPPTFHLAPRSLSPNILELKHDPSLNSKTVNGLNLRVMNIVITLNKNLQKKNDIETAGGNTIIQLLAK